MKFHPSIVTSTFVSPLGPMTLAATDAGLAGVWFEASATTRISPAGL
ncbi:MAG: hypothetical protein IPF71_03220 [Rhodoferax sp.]|nr:hypothetical protein [Rhodoferax sp.]